MNSWSWNWGTEDGQQITDFWDYLDSTDEQRTESERHQREHRATVRKRNLYVTPHGIHPMQWTNERSHGEGFGGCGGGNVKDYCDDIKREVLAGGKASEIAERIGMDASEVYRIQYKLRSGIIAMPA